MQKFIHNVALLSSIIVLSCALWQDWGTWLTVKRIFISYLGFFTIGSCLFLAFKAVPRGESKHSPGFSNDGMESANARGSHLTRKVG